MSKFSERLRKLRTSRGISQQKLADCLGASKSSINMYERGEREPGLDMLENIADFFNVDMDYLHGKTNVRRYAMNIQSILKNRRLELGLTLLDVAKQVGVSEGTVSRWESGDIANMRRDRIMALATALDLSPAVIMGWEEDNNSTGKTAQPEKPAEDELSEMQVDILKRLMALSPKKQEQMSDYLDFLLSQQGDE